MKIVMMVVMDMVMIKCWGLQNKKEKNKKLKAKVISIGAFVFCRSRLLASVITFMIDSRTIKRVKLVSECGYQSATRCSNSLHMHLGSSGELTPLKMFVKIC